MMRRVDDDDGGDDDDVDDVTGTTGLRLVQVG